MGSSGVVLSDQPTVTDLKGCDAWLARVALADSRHACRELTGLLEALEEAPPRDDAYIEILERLREPIFVAQTELEKKFSRRPLPLKDYETTAVEQVVDLLTAFGRAYRLLLEGLVNHGRVRPGLRDQGALLAQRSLDCLAELMLTYYRCRHELDAELWQLLHKQYRHAQDLGVLNKTIPSERNSKTVSSPEETYVRSLLLALADPYGLSARELNWVRRWSMMWAYKVGLTEAPGESEGYVVDTRGDKPPSWSTGVARRPGLLFLNSSNLRRSIRSRLKKLEAGEDPLSLSLGNDCVQPETGRLLQVLSRAWTEQPSARQFARRPTPARTELTTGFESIHIAISGKVFRGDAPKWDYARRDTESLFTYHGTRSTQPIPVSTTEKWETLDQSATGFRLRRQSLGERLYQQQLIALKPEDARCFILCEVRWLIVGIDRSLTVGTSAMPGLALGIAARPVVAASDAPEAFTQAFLLPETLQGPATLVIPVAWFQHERQIELVVEDNVQRVTLQTHVQRGYDFDRATFKTIA